MDDKVYISKIKITNIGGLDHFEAQMGDICLVTGANGVGKSSVLGALNIVFAGGTDPAIIKKGEDFGEVLLTLSDGTTINKRIVPDGAEVKIRTKDGGAVKRPAEYLASLASGMGFDPIGLLAAEPKKRAEFLLKNLSLTFEASEVNAALDAPTQTGTLSLAKFNELRDGRYDQRTDLNRRVKEQEATITELTRSLPKGEKEDWGAIALGLQDSINKISTDIAREEASIKEEAGDAIKENRATVAAKIRALEQEQHAFEVECLREQDRAIAENTRELGERRAAMSIELGTARSNADQQQQSVGIRKAIADRDTALKGSVTEEMRLTKIIKALDELKHRKLKELPIDGFDLKIDKGKPIITINGVELEKLNRQQAIFVAIQAVSLASGKLPLILCEASELDDNSLRDLTAACKDAKLQLVLARWQNDSPLEVVSA